MAAAPTPPADHRRATPTRRHTGPAATPPRRQQAAVNALYRHHWGRPDGDALYRAAVEAATRAEHPDCPDDVIAILTDRRCRSTYTRLLVDQAVAMACGVAADNYQQRLAVLAAQAPGAPGNNQGEL